MCCGDFYSSSPYWFTRQGRGHMAVDWIQTGAIMIAKRGGYHCHGSASRPAPPTSRHLKSAPTDSHKGIELTKPSAEQCRQLEQSVREAVTSLIGFREAINGLGGNPGIEMMSRGDTSVSAALRRFETARNQLIESLTELIGANQALARELGRCGKPAGLRRPTATQSRRSRPGVVAGWPDRRARL